MTATQNRALLLEKRREALRLSFELFSSSVAEQIYLQLESSFKNLKFNGNVLNTATAPKLREIRLSGYFCADSFRRGENAPFAGLACLEANRLKVIISQALDRDAYGLFRLKGWGVMLS